MFHACIWDNTTGSFQELYRELDKQKARLYEQYGEVKRELKEYGIIKQNVDSILRVTPGKEQAQEL